MTEGAVLPGAQADKKRDGFSHCERSVSVLHYTDIAAFCRLPLSLYALASLRSFKRLQTLLPEPDGKQIPFHTRSP